MLIFNAKIKYNNNDIYIFPAKSEGKKCAKIMLNCESFARHDLWFLRGACSRALYFQQPIQPTKT